MAGEALHRPKRQASLVRQIKHPWENVHAAWEGGEQDPNFIKEEKNVVWSGTTATITKTIYTRSPFPKVMRFIIHELGQDMLVFGEEQVIDMKKREASYLSVNKNLKSIGSAYRAASMRQDPSNPEWTLFEQEGGIELSSGYPDAVRGSVSDTPFSPTLDVPPPFFSDRPPPSRPLALLPSDQFLSCAHRSKSLQDLPSCPSAAALPTLSRNSSTWQHRRWRWRGTRRTKRRWPCPLFDTMMMVLMLALRQTDAISFSEPIRPTSTWTRLTRRRRRRLHRLNAIPPRRLLPLLHHHHHPQEWNWAIPVALSAWSSGCSNIQGSSSASSLRSSPYRGTLA